MKKYIFPILCLTLAFVSSHFAFAAPAYPFLPLLALGLIEGTGIKWDNVAKERGNPGSAAKLAERVTKYFRQPLEDLKVLRGMKSPGLDPNLLPPPPVEVIKARLLEDFGYLDIYKQVDMRKSASTSFKVVGVKNGIVFYQLKEGEPIKMSKITTDSASVEFLRFGAGISFLDEFFQFQQYYLMDDLLVTTRNASYNAKAKLHYDLISTCGPGINQAFVTDDATTIDAASAVIINACKDKGYFDKEKPQFIVLANPALERRLTKAIWPSAAVTGPQNLQGPVTNIKRLVTSWHIATGNYYVILPGNKLQSGTWKDLYMEPSRNASAGGNDYFWREQYAAALLDTDQLKRCALA